MKKILFATTALVATAGVAAADVTFGGLGRFGVDYDDARGNNATSGQSTTTRMESRFRLVITGTAESDNGLSFGAQMRYQANENATGAFNSPRFWVTSGGLTVSTGQVLGAVESMPGMYAGSLGLTGLGYHNVAYNFGADAYSSGAAGRQGLDVIYSSGAFGVHLSHSWSLQSQQTAATTNNVTRTAINGSYSTGQYTFAVALQNSGGSAASNTDTKWAASAAGSFGPVDLTLVYADNDADGGKVNLGANWQAGSSTFVRAYIAQDQNKVASATLAAGKYSSYGIGFQHRLGGGTFIEGGVVRTKTGVATLTNRTRADLGLRFSF